MHHARQCSARPRGFFGLFALLLCIPALLLINSSGLRAGQDYMALEGGLLEISKSGFERAQSELFFDRAIGQGLAGPHIGPLDAAAIKSGINASIVSAPNTLGIGEFYWCSESILGELQLSPLGPEGLDGLSKVAVLKAGPVAHVQYILSGGPHGDAFPCAKISNGSHSLFLRIPAGYFSSAAVIFA